MNVHAALDASTYATSFIGCAWIDNKNHYMIQGLPAQHSTAQHAESDPCIENYTSPRQLRLHRVVRVYAEGIHALLPTAYPVRVMSQSLLVNQCLVFKLLGFQHYQELSADQKGASAENAKPDCPSLSSQVSTPGQTSAKRGSVGQ